MKLAIVGTSKLQNFELKIAINLISNEITYRSPQPKLVITGDALGIDQAVRNYAYMSSELSVIAAPHKDWEGDGGFRDRNKQIAIACDELICITTTTKQQKCYHCHADHQRTGGCYTMQFAKNLGKPVRLYVV